MPTYEFRCPSGHVFEKFSPTMTGQRHAICPKCRKRAERQLSGGGLVFKGSGFYITDYKRAGEKRPEGESKPSGDVKTAESAKPTEGAKAAGSTKSKTPKTDK